MEEKEIVILGGDMRQYYMAEYLGKMGYIVTVFGEVYEKINACIQLQTIEEVFEKLGQKGICVVLPVPVTIDGDTIKGTDGKLYLEEICPHMKEKEKVYGGNIPTKLRCMCEIKQGQCMDFMQSEQVAYLNAVSTAEGSIAEAISLGKGQLTGSNCLVLGFGKCGSILADKLSRFGAAVTVMERSQKRRARAVAYGLGSCDFDNTNSYEKYDYIFNTVPAMVMDRSVLERCNKEVVIIDIASAPGGVDYGAAGQLGITAKLCPGLPGKYAPKAAGEILAEELIRIETLK